MDAKSWESFWNFVWDYFGMREREKARIDSVVRFSSYRLDLGEWQGCAGTQESEVDGKAFAVLHYFVAHPGQLSPENSFRPAGHRRWSVTPPLASCIQELRRHYVMMQGTRYIETVHPARFRFVGKVLSDQLSVVSFPPPAALPRPQLATGSWQLTTSLVGRETN